MVGVAQQAKPLGVPIGLTVEPGNTHDGRHMLRTFGQVRNDLSEGSTMIFDAGANNKTVLDTIVEDGKHYLTRKRFNRSDDAILAGFSEDAWECIDAEKGEYCLKRVFPSRVNYYFFSRELRDLERKGVEKRARKKLKEAKDLQRDLEQGRKLRKRYRIDNVLIKATISLQTKLTEITEEEALSLLLEKGITGREGFFCLVSDRDMDPREARSKYRSKDVVEKLFSSMKSDIGIRPIRAWTDDAVDGVLLIGFLALDDGMKFIGGGIVVLGEIQTTGDGSNVTDYVGTEYTVTDAADRTKKTTYITTFELALADIATADKQTITVHGPVEVATGFILADDQTIDITDATMTIGTDAKVELQNGATIDGTVQEVKGILYVYKGGVMRNEPAMYAVSGTNKTTGDKMYAGLEAAIANSQPGDVITVVAKGYENGVTVENNLEIPADRTVIIDTDKAVTFEKNLTIAEGATLTNKGTVNMSGDKAVVTVNGVFDNSTTNKLNFTDATNGNVNIGGQYIVPITEDFTAIQYSVNGAYYDSEGKRIVTTFAKAVTATGAVEGDQPVNVIGKITESGEVTVDTDTVTISGEASLGTVTVDNAEITIADGASLTATVNGAYGAEGSTSAASIVLTKATDMTVSNYSEIDAMNVTNWYNSISAVNGNVNIASGEVILTAYGDATVDENSVLKVSSGATLIVDAERTLTINDAKYLTVEGTVIIESPVIFNANVAIDGTLDIRDTLTVASSAKLTITGTLTVSADEENLGTLTVEGRLNIGETPELVSTAATGTANGAVSVGTTGVVVVYNGASVADATILNGVNAVEPTAFVVNGYNYAAVYGAAKVNYLDTEILGLKDIKDRQTIEWYADGAKIVDPANVAVGTYAEVSTTLAWEDVSITVSVGPGLEVYVDDLKVWGKTAFAVGEHKITVYIKPNYEGTPEITLNGQAITGDSFTLTADMIDGENILYVTGVSPSDSTIVIDGGNNGGDDGLGLTDILLIILVILIVIMAIMVAMRLMRS